jgi:hypothetical protein
LMHLRRTLATSGRYPRARPLISQPGLLLLRSSSKFGSPERRLVFGPSPRWSLPATMASADFCRPVPTPLDVGSTRQIGRSPRVMRVTFLPYTRRIYSPTLPDGYRALKVIAFSPGWDCLVCGFCSSGRDFACGFLRIPPRGRHPCRSASGSRHQGPQGTCTPKSLIDHHSLSSGAYAPRAMPGAPQRESPPSHFEKGGLE